MKTVIRNNKGFTLIEMAIVLVIIGVIIGAVVKGQDLIESAKSKQFASKIQAWQISLSTYYDRKGRYPGDSNKDGVIGDSNAQTDITDAKLVSAPENTFTVGGSTFFVYLGNNGGTSPKNYLVVCKDSACTTKFDPASSSDLTALKFLEAYDTAIDGSADATVGNVTGATVVTASAAAGVATSITFGTVDVDWLIGNDKVALALHLK